MKILVVNCGSSSLKYQIIDMENESVLAKGNFERIGEEEAFLTHKVNGDKYVTIALNEEYNELGASNTFNNSKYIDINGSVDNTKVGTYRLRYKGSSGGHNGLKNIELHLSTKDYKRIKVGISNDKNIDTKDYVLGKFTKDIVI